MAEFDMRGDNWAGTEETPNGNQSRQEPHICKKPPMETTKPPMGIITPKAIKLGNPAWVTN